MKYCVEETTHTQREVVANVTSGIMEKVSLSQRLLDALILQYLETTVDECTDEQEHIADMLAAISGTLHSAITEYQLITGGAYMGRAGRADQIQLAHEVKEAHETIGEMLTGVPANLQNTVIERDRALGDLPDEEALPQLEALMHKITGQTAGECIG